MILIKELLKAILTSKKVMEDLVNIYEEMDQENTLVFYMTNLGIKILHVLHILNLKEAMCLVG
jgi:hypothetical protein